MSIYNTSGPQQFQRDIEIFLDENTVEAVHSATERFRTAVADRNIPFQTKQKEWARVFIATAKILRPILEQFKISDATVNGWSNAVLEDSFLSLTIRRVFKNNKLTIPQKNIILDCYLALETETES